MRLLVLFAVLSGLVALGPTVSLGQVAPKPTISVLHRFTGHDGEAPPAPLFQASDGNFYGTTTWGGDDGYGCPQLCQGTGFKLTKDGAFTLLHTFATPGAGLKPSGGLAAGP